jgi:hypothetical protein
MAATAWHSADEQFEQIVQRAAVEGFELVQFETPHGQLVWAWRRGDEARPEFVSRRVALNFMEDWLRRNAAHHHWSLIRKRASR